MTHKTCRFVMRSHHVGGIHLDHEFAVATAFQRVGHRRDRRARVADDVAIRTRLLSTLFVSDVHQPAHHGHELRDRGDLDHR